ncbi:hypothetical protein KM043_003294 [Ampulex compressa]|nr:hypothetical protein KM043_003294 [Ampulex compressa]
MERRKYEEATEEQGSRGRNVSTLVSRAERVDAEEEDGEAAATLAIAKAGLCAICHLTSHETFHEETSNTREGNPSCPEGHLFCHRCRRRFSIRPDAACILCGKRSQESRASCSREGDALVNQDHAKAGGTYEALQKQRFRSRSPMSLEETSAKLWGPRHGPEGGTTSYDVGGSEIDSQREAGKGRSAHRRRSYCSTVGAESSPERRGSQLKVNGQPIGTTECSRKPIRCPRLDCAVNVAFSALAHHFVFDHPDVPILSVEPGTKSTLIVSSEALSRDSSRCLALLLVSGKLSDPAARLFSGNQIDPRYRKRLPLAVLAARLECTGRFLTPDETWPDDRCEKNVIIAWLAGLDIGEATEGLRCSIQAVDRVDAEEVRSLMYTGPVNSLRRAQEPREVFSAGDCIVLHEGLIDRITSEHASLQVNVIVH